MKTCTKCSIEKPLHEFRIGRNKCIECIKEYNKEYLKEYRQDNKEKIKEYRQNNKEKAKEYKQNYYKNNKEKAKEYKQNNIERYKEYQKKYRENNKENIKESHQKYYKKNKRKVIKYGLKYCKDRKKVDVLFKLSFYLRTRILKAIKRKGYSKNTRTTDILGCTIEQVRTHLEQQFRIGMNWDNHGKWHIDHIIPLASAKDEQELLKLCHYTNLQPLWAEENLRKGARLDFVQSPISNNRTY